MCNRPTHTVLAAEEHFHKLEHMYMSLPFNRYFEPKLKVREGSAELCIPIRSEFFHAAHALHGSVYFKALDDSSFFAVSSLVRDVFVFTVSFNIYFTHPVTSGVLHAHGQVVHQSKNLFLAESELTDVQGRQVGRGSGCFMRSTIQLSPSIGYE